MNHLGDIKKIDGSRVPPVNVIIGGSPCQDLSTAGNRAGLAGERSGLFMEQIRIIKEMRNADEARGSTGKDVRPRFMVWENVPGAFSSNKGADFGTVLNETAKIACSEAPVIPVPPHGWPTAGCLMGMDGEWSLAWRVLDAQFWGVPQRRRRIALVADFGGFTAPEILFERKGVSGDSEESRKTRKAAARAAESTANAASGGNFIDRACAADCNRRGWSKDKYYSLNTIERSAVYDARGNGYGNIAPTITGDHENRVTDYTALVMASGQANAEITENKSPTLNCNHDVPIVFGKEVYNSGEGSTGGHYITEGGSSPALITSCPPGVYIGWDVRRFTPLECERLQGFPDGWTDIGEWIDSKGRRHPESSDAARYKALGNSIAIPPWTWVLIRLNEFCEDKTMASLFDGIGGFPFIWERLNGRGSCVWASEIEEFPIAVTKMRFEADEG